ncbi:MAG: radical SAM protein [Candidatus Bathyarchaeota archaeon]|nr:radical SAM protein [Candidatus Bathyarchaeota archaeon A05DMB-5]MDH7558055.1 radical SAM protein [Candidatus Bathyarchaeota archaeon]
MSLKGVHFLLTYRCDLECDHCFVWGSPKAKGTFTLEQIRNILEEARKLPTVDYIAIEGGEPFLYYPIMVKAASEAAEFGFRVEILSNCYWATCPDDAVEWLRPIAEIKNVELTLSSDFYHGENWETETVRNAVKAAHVLQMKADILAIKDPHAAKPCPKEIEGAKVDLCELMYKGRAFSKLPQSVAKKPWREFTKCPYENFANQERVHIDPLGYVHVCQGISIGNAWQKPFAKIIEEYNPYENPILEPLVRSGPVALVEKFCLSHEEAYADACHMCYAARLLLRNKYPDVLAPDQMYGEFE